MWPVRARGIRQPKEDDGYEVGKPEPYFPDNELDFTYFARSTTMEQVSKGTHFLSSIDTRLKKLDRLDTLPRDIAKELAKELRKQK